MWSSKKFVWSLLILASMLLTIPSTTCAQAVPATSNPVSGRPLTIEKIVSADVLARVGLLRDEIELIRFEMGQPKNQQTEIVVTDVIPRQVIFQAMTLFRKANQLHFELTGESGNELGTNLPAEIRPLHVWLIVNAAYRRILTVKRKLGITEHIEENPQDLSTTPTEVFRAIIQAHRQFDWLLKQRPWPGILQTIPPEIGGLSRSSLSPSQAWVVPVTALAWDIVNDPVVIRRVIQGALSLPLRLGLLARAARA